VRVVSWNVADRSGRLAAQLNAVVGRGADVSLQRFPRAPTRRGGEGLLAAGYSVVSAGELSLLPYPPPPYPQRIKQPADSPQELQPDGGSAPDRLAPGASLRRSQQASLPLPEKFVAAEHGLRSARRGRQRARAARAMCSSRRRWRRWPGVWMSERTYRRSCAAISTHRDRSVRANARGPCKSLRRLWVAAISCHSERHAALPPRRNRSILRLNFVSAKTGPIMPGRRR
jgi:hypothetical protein